MIQDDTMKYTGHGFQKYPDQASLIHIPAYVLLVFGAGEKDAIVA
jgi:hypothetical protein